MAPLDAARLAAMAAEVGARAGGAADEPSPAPAWTPPPSMADLLASPALLEPPAQMVPNLVLAGGRVTLLHGREKLGKSTLAGAVVAAASTGGAFLGGSCTPATVLVVCLDEPVADCVRRLRELGADPARIYVRDSLAGPSFLARDIAATGATLVLLDALKDLLRGRVQSENNASEVDAAVAPFLAVHRATGASALWLHHAGKANGGREYRGSSSLGAAVDVLASLSAPPRPEGDDEWDDPDVEADPERRLEVVGRGIRWRGRLRFDGGRYELATGAPTLADRILTAVARSPGASGNAICGAVGGRREKVLATVIDLVTDGRLANVGGPSQARYQVARGSAAMRVEVVPGVVPDPLAGPPREPPREPLMRYHPTPSEPPGTAQEPPGTLAGTTTARSGSRSEKPRLAEREPPPGGLAA